MENKLQNNQLPTSFGQQLKMWRKKRGLSQLQLALSAHTTPRHLSFIESGRSRPGRDIVLRLSQCLDLSVRNCNSLLLAAGLPPQFPEREFDKDRPSPFHRAIEQILKQHEPYPGCAFDSLGRVILCNEAQRRFVPGCEIQTPEESIDAWFGPGANRDFIQNWAEVAWNWVDRQLHEAARTNNQELAKLVERALRHLGDTERPAAHSDNDPDVFSTRFRIGDKVIRTFATVMRFETAQEVTLSELRVELLFPFDETAAEFFHDLKEQSESNLCE
ncbi:MAG: helix-turn-helix transcriptional regulator [Fuerstiella sp.]